MTDGKDLFDRSDHDLLITLAVRLERADLDRIEMLKTIGKIELSLKNLEDHAAASKGGWRVLVGVGSIIGLVIGWLVHLISVK